MKKDTDLVVIFQDGTHKSGCIINPDFLDKQNKWDKLEDIKKLHMERLNIEYLMSIIDDPVELDRLTKLHLKNDDKLQEIWGFEIDKKYYKFWRLPKCACPKMDNEDIYPSDSYYYNGSCLLHRKETK